MFSNRTAYASVDGEYVMGDCSDEYKTANLLESDCEDVRDIGSVMVVSVRGGVAAIERLRSGGRWYVTREQAYDMLVSQFHSSSMP